LFVESCASGLPHKTIIKDKHVKKREMLCEIILFNLSKFVCQFWLSRISNVCIFHIPQCNTGIWWRAAIKQLSWASPDLCTPLPWIPLYSNVDSSWRRSGVSLSLSIHLCICGIVIDVVQQNGRAVKQL